MQFFRAHDHAEVIRPRAFGSTNPISDAEEDEKPKKPLRGRKQAPKGSDDESGAVLKDLLGTYKSRALNREKLEEEKLKLDQGLLELAKQKEKREARFSEAGAWEQIMRMTQHENPHVRKRGEAMAKELAEQEE